MGIHDAYSIIEKSDEGHGTDEAVVRHGIITEDTFEYIKRTERDGKVIMVVDVSCVQHRATNGIRNSRGANVMTVSNAKRSAQGYRKLDRTYLDPQYLAWSDPEIAIIVKSMFEHTMEYCNVDLDQLYLVLEGKPTDLKRRCRPLVDGEIDAMVTQLSNLYACCSIESGREFESIAHNLDEKRNHPSIDVIIARILLRFAVLDVPGWIEIATRYIKKCTTEPFAEYIFDHLDDIRQMQADTQDIWWNKLLHLIRGHYPAPRKRIQKAYTDYMRMVCTGIEMDWRLFNDGEYSTVYNPATGTTTSMPWIQPEYFIREMHIVRAETEADFDIARISQEWTMSAPGRVSIIVSADSDFFVIGAGYHEWRMDRETVRTVDIEYWWKLMVRRFATRKPLKEIEIPRDIRHIVLSIVKYLCCSGTDYTTAGDDRLSVEMSINLMKQGKVSIGEPHENIMTMWGSFIDSRVELMEAYFVKHLDKWKDAWEAARVSITNRKRHMISVNDGAAAGADDDDAPPPSAEPHELAPRSTIQVSTTRQPYVPRPTRDE